MGHPLWTFPYWCIIAYLTSFQRKQSSWFLDKFWNSNHSPTTQISALCLVQDPGNCLPSSRKTWRAIGDFWRWAGAATTPAVARPYAVELLPCGRLPNGLPLPGRRPIQQSGKVSDTYWTYYLFLLKFSIEPTGLPYTTVVLRLTVVVK